MPLARYEMVCGAFRSGVVVCPCTSSLSPPELEDRVRRSHAVALVGKSPHIQTYLSNASSPVQHVIQLDTADTVPGALSYASFLKLGKIDDADGPTLSNESCLLYFTSGTTGNAKIVQHSHVSYPYGRMTVIPAPRPWLT
jgi:acyl-coenzyme A synthetase/AMP-(fatty) acid ligase